MGTDGRVVPAWVVPTERQAWDLYRLAFGVHMATRDEVPAPQRPGGVFVTVFGAAREMDMPDRRRRQRLAPVWLAVAPQTAPTQLCVELLKQPRGDLADGHVAQRRLGAMPRSLS